MEHLDGRMRPTRRWIAMPLLGLVLGLVPVVTAEAQALRKEETREQIREWPEGKRGRIIGGIERFEDSTGADFTQFSGFVSYKQTWYQGWVGDWFDGFALGGYLRDSRRSTYGAWYRYRDEFDHVLQVETEQVLPEGFVFAASLRGIKIRNYEQKRQIAAVTGDEIGDEYQMQFGTGMDWYWGDYNFLTFRATNDPRESGRWTFLLGHRFSKTERIYIQPTIILRTDDTTNWFIRGQYKYLVAMVGEFNEFDFTDVDRKVFYAAFEIRY